MPASLRSFTDAAADAVARAIATVHREAQREKEVREAEYRARLAELDARIVSVVDLERRVSERLASLKDGEPGRDGRDGKDGQNGSDGRDGASVSLADCEPLIRTEAERVAAETAERILAGWDRPQDGKSVTVEELSPLVEESVQRAVAALPVPVDGKDGRDGTDGKDGERGLEGPAGKLPIVQEWTDGVHYEGAIVSRDGSLYQAARDTGKEPGHEDWTCIVERGRDGVDGRSFNIRGTWAADGEYLSLDVAMLNGASFVAKRDNPGACPGEGWQLLAAQGKRGNPGDRGAPGMGERGIPGQPVVAADVDANGMLTLTNGDGSTVKCDLYPLLSRLG